MTTGRAGEYNRSLTFVLTATIHDPVEALQHHAQRRARPHQSGSASNRGHPPSLPPPPPNRTRAPSSPPTMRRSRRDAQRSTKGIRQVQLSHTSQVKSAVFDEPNLVSS